MKQLLLIPFGILCLALNLIQLISWVVFGGRTNAKIQTALIDFMMHGLYKIICDPITICYGIRGDLDALADARRVLMISNHTSGQDFLYLSEVAGRFGRRGELRFFLKKSIRWFPILWGVAFADYIALDRKMDSDKMNIIRKLGALRRNYDHVWVGLFPEGTRNAVVGKPKIGGFALCMKQLSDLDDFYIVDVTICKNDLYVTVFHSAEIGANVESFLTRQFDLKRDIISTF